MDQIADVKTQDLAALFRFGFRATLTVTPVSKDYFFTLRVSFLEPNFSFTKLKNLSVESVSIFG